MRRLLMVATFAAALGGIGVAHAQSDEARRIEHHEGVRSPEGGSGMPGADVNENEATGIENWWDLDYKSKHLPPPFGFALINFAVFLGVMAKLAWGPLKKFVAERSVNIAKDLDAAAELHKQAEAELQKYQAKIAGINGEIDTLLAGIRKEAEQEKQRIIAAAEADAVRMKQDAERQIEAEIEQARRELRRGVIEAAVNAAGAAIQKNIAADDQRKMAEHYVADVEKQANTRRPS